MNGVLFCIIGAVVAGALVYGIMHRRLSALQAAVFHDGLVNGYTYSYIKYKAPEIMKKGGSFLLVYLDIDNFQYFSQTFGFDKKNMVLKEVYGEVSGAFGVTDSLTARYHSDKFVIFCKDDEAVDDILRSTIERLEQIVARLDIDYVLSFSMGACRITEGKASVDIALERAISAHCKYRKEPVRQEYIFSEDMQRQIALEKTIQSHMNSALKNAEFEILFHPKMDLRTKKVAGAEALVRWNSPDIGYMSPNDFIPIFEKTGFIQELDFFVLETACRLIDRRIAICGEGKAIPVSVNQSRQDCFNPNYLENIKSIIDKYSINPKLIEFEITESAFLDDIDVSMDTMSRLRQSGFKISVDDFGLGYTSLSFLKQINVDIIKIDKELVESLENDADNRKQVKSFIDMSHSLGLQVVGEGVENVAQAEILIQMGCDYAQGYYFAKPMTADDLERFIIDTDSMAV